MDTAPAPMPASTMHSSPRPLMRIVWVAAIIALAVLAAALYLHFHYRPAAVTVPRTPLEAALFDANAAFNANNPDDALTNIDKALSLNPNSVEALTFKSVILAQKGTLLFREAEYGAQAAAVAQQAIAVDGTYSDAYRALGYADEIQKKYADAHTAYAKALELNPKNALAIFGDAHVYDLEGNADKAEAGYTAALAADPSALAAEEGLGRIANQKGDTDGALAHFRKVLAGSSNLHTKSEAAFSVGMLLIAKDDFASASTSLAQATTLDPGYASAWYGIGFLEYAIASASTTPGETRGQHVLASIDAFTKAIRLNHALTVAHIGIAEDALVLGLKPSALNAINNAGHALQLDNTLTPDEKQAAAGRIADLKLRVAKMK